MSHRPTIIASLVEAPKLVLLFLLLGILVMAASTGLFVCQWQRTAGFSHVEGRVAYYHNNQPVIQYEVAGKTYETRGPGNGKHPPRVGDGFTVYFPDDDPSQARLTSVLFQWIFPCVFGFVGFRFTRAAAIEIWPSLCSSHGSSTRQRVGIVGRVKATWRLIFPRKSTGVGQV